MTRNRPRGPRGRGSGPDRRGRPATHGRRIGSGNAATHPSLDNDGLFAALNRAGRKGLDFDDVHREAVGLGLGLSPSAMHGLCWTACKKGRLHGAAFAQDLSHHAATIAGQRRRAGVRHPVLARRGLRLHALRPGGPDPRTGPRTGPHPAAAGAGLRCGRPGTRLSPPPTGGGLSTRLRLRHARATGAAPAQARSRQLRRQPPLLRAGGCRASLRLACYLFSTSRR